MGEFKLDFTGIGVAKAGTTWIAHHLARHPQVCMAADKETNFFLRKHIYSCLPVHRYHYGSAHYDEGLEWYERRFTHHERGQVRGEYSNAYLADPASPGLLHDHNPEVKLLCSFRNPADAAYAAYFQISRVQPLPDTFEEFLERYPPLLEYGRYHHNLQPFLETFPRERIHLIVYDDLQADPAGVFRGICEFLEIDPSFVPEDPTHRVNPRTILRSRRIRNLRCALGAFLASTPATRKLRTGLLRLGTHKMALSLFRLNEKPGTVPPMSRETRQRLVEFFREDTEALARLLDRDLSHWTEPPPLDEAASGPSSAAESARTPA